MSFVLPPIESGAEFRRLPMSTSSSGVIMRSVCRFGLVSSFGIAFAVASCSKGGGGGGDNAAETGNVAGRLGAPPPGSGVPGSSSGLRATRKALSVAELEVVFTSEDGTEHSVHPTADGQVAGNLPVGAYRVTIRQNALSPVVYNTETRVEVTANSTANFFLPRIAWYALHSSAKVDTCGRKVTIDEASGRFALGTSLGLVIGNLGAPDDAAIIYDENSFAGVPALLALAENGNKLLAVFANSVRVYDLSNIAPGTVEDCSNLDCFTEHALSEPPPFPVDAGACSRIDGPGGSMDRPAAGAGAGEGDAGQVGGIARNYSVYHDAVNRVFILQIADWAAFVDDATGEVRRVIAQGGRFQGKHAACDQYVFTFANGEGDFLVRIVDRDLRVAREFSLKERAPTIETVFNGADDPVTTNFFLSLGLLANDNSTLSALMRVDTCAADPVVELDEAATVLGATEALTPGPIGATEHSIVLADSIFDRDSNGTARTVVMNSLGRVDLRALSANTNPYFQVDANARTYFVYGSVEKNAGMGFVHAGDPYHIMGFVMRLGTEATKHVEMSSAHGAVIAVTADGRVYWVLYDSELQPSDHINHAALGKDVFDRHHPVCSVDDPCPDHGVCVPNTDFVNSAGTCTPQPPGVAREWCGGVTNVECDSGYRCAEAEGQAGRCTPRTDCTVDEACPSGYVCTVEPQKLGGGGGAAGDDCTTDPRGKPTCCREMEPGRWLCCDETGACSETTTPPDGGTGGGTSSGPACVAAGEDLCGGLHEAPCADGASGPRRCVTGLAGMPVDVGVCEKSEGEFCRMPGQCATGLVCSMTSQRCEAQCRTSADCRTNGGTAVCEFQGHEGGAVCNPYSTQPCADDEVWSDMTGRCTTDQPCEPYAPSGRTGCDDGEVCVEDHREGPGAFCRVPCATTRDCAQGEVCGVDPMMGPNSAPHCTTTERGCTCGLDQWCALDTQACQSGAYCNHETPCADGMVCFDQSHTCVLACEVNDDCTTSGEVCVAQWDAKRVCRPNDWNCNCGANEYCSTSRSTTCFGAENPPCNTNNQNCPGDTRCDLERNVCIDDCAMTSECDPGEICALLDDMMGDKRACRTRDVDEPSCAGEYFLRRGQCAKVPRAGCTQSVGCAVGEQCDQWGLAGSSVCICVDQTVCTTCTSDAECMNGTRCDGTACEWKDCSSVPCANGEVCADWMGTGSSVGNGTTTAGGSGAYPSYPVCFEPGPGATGTGCARHTDCASLACATGVCVDRCDTTADCGGDMCVVGETWSTGNFAYCAENACANSCADDEVCLSRDGRCSRYRSCPDNGACPDGTFCNWNDRTCRPSCSTTADCAAGENCAVQMQMGGATGSSTNARYCVDAATSECRTACAPTERCSGGHCTTFEPCGTNNTCADGFACDTSQNLCKPSCTLSSDCAASEVCVVGWMDMYGNRPRYCVVTASSPCTSGCDRDETCRQERNTCSSYEPCGNNRTCAQGYQCDWSDSCVPTCSATSQCRTGEQCVNDGGMGFARCLVPDSNNRCMCAAHLVCLDTWSGACGDVATCSTWTECRDAHGAHSADYNCKSAGSGQHCVCENTSSTECVNCAGDHTRCGSGLLCDPSGVCLEVTCNPLNPSCPNGTRCMRSDANSQNWACGIATDARPDGIGCDRNSQCLGGACAWSGAQNKCTSACLSSGACTGDCVQSPNDKYGECQSEAQSSCTSACADDQVCHSWQMSCMVPCTTNAGCTAGSNCDRHPTESFGSCKALAGAISQCSAECTEAQFCSQATWPGACATP